MLREKARMLKNWRGVVFGSTSAILGSQSTLFMKSLSELLKGLITRGQLSRVHLPSSSQHSVPHLFLARFWRALILMRFSSAGEFGALINPFTYAILAGFIGSLSFWLMRLNRGLAEFDALFIVPVMQVQWTTLSVIEGIIYFEEYNDMSITSGGIFAAALVVIFFGVYLLSSGGPTRQYDALPAGEADEVRLATCDLLLATCYLLLTTYYLLLTTYYLLLTTCYW